MGPPNNADRHVAAAARPGAAAAPGTAPRHAPDGLTSLAGVIFDVPDVIYDATLWRRWLVQLLHRLGVEIAYASFAAAWDARLADVHCGRRDFDEALESHLLDCGLSWAQVDEVEAAGRIQRAKLEADARPFPGAVRVIEELARRRLCLAAWADLPLPAEGLAERLARWAPQARFEVALTSFDLEAAQPAAACYRALLAAMGLSGGQVLYVGHDTAHLAAAAAAGLQTAAFNHAPEARAEHLLAQFDDLLRIVPPRAAGPQPSLGSAAGSQGLPRPAETLKT
jgi:FMN phosphatase YigB (HAD superfamily)